MRAANATASESWGAGSRARMSQLQLFTGCSLQVETKTRSSGALRIMLLAESQSGGHAHLVHDLTTVQDR